MHPNWNINSLAFIYQSPTAQAKRDSENRIVDHLFREQTPVFKWTYANKRNADWYVIPARRADRLVHEKLYERVFATRVPRLLSRSEPPGWTCIYHCPDLTPATLNAG